MARFCWAFAFCLVLAGSLSSTLRAEPVAADSGPVSGLDEARGLLAKHQWAEAAIVLRRILRISHDSPSVAMDLARALIYGGRREEALSILSQAANEERGSRRAVLLRRSRVLSRLFLTNETFQIHAEGLNLLSMRKYRPARERFERALEKEPDNVEILVRIGQCLVMDGDFDSAAERLRLARKLNPHEPEIHLWLGRALHQRGELAESIEELRAVEADLPGSELAPVWLAEALVSSGQRAAAVHVLEEDIKSQPFHLLGLLTLAKIRYAGAVRDKSALWAVRKDLQVALSRLDRYLSPDLPEHEGELGVQARSPEKVKEEISLLLQRVDSRLQGHLETE